MDKLKLSVYVTPEQKAEWERLAREDRRSLNTWIQMQVERSIDRQASFLSVVPEVRKA